MRITCIKVLFLYLRLTVLRHMTFEFSTYFRSHYLNNNNNNVSFLLPDLVCSSDVFSHAELFVFGQINFTLV